MRKKFNFICVLLALALLFSIVFPFTLTFGSGFAQGWVSDNKSVQKPEGVTTAVTILPKNGPANFTHQIHNEKNGKDENMAILQAVVNSPSQDKESNRAFNIGMPVLGFISLALSVAFIECFIKIILAVNRNEIFDVRMEKRLAKCGWILIGYYAVQWIIVIANHLLATSLFEFKDYIIAIIDFPNAAALISGIGLMLVGQIFGIGRKMKEEQELTI